MDIKFTASCCCNPQDQNQVNAAYYNQRGRFHLYRDSPKHALPFMREAYRLVITNRTYRDDYFMARVAAGKFEMDEEEIFQGDDAFHNEGDFRGNRMEQSEKLRKRREQIVHDTQHQNLPREWSYVDATTRPTIIVKPNELHAGVKVYEMEDPESRAILGSREAAKQRLAIWG